MDDVAKKPRGRGRGAARGRGRGKARASAAATATGGATAPARVGRGRAAAAKAAAVAAAATDDDDTKAPVASSPDASAADPSEADQSSASSAAVEEPPSKPAAVDDADAATAPVDTSGAVAVAAADTTADSSVAVELPVAAESSPMVGAGLSLNADALPAIDMETADISQLETPTFTTLSRGPPEPMTRLRWDHKVNLIGEKVLHPLIHCCDECADMSPIMVYGRMLPCKHVFCLDCGRAEANQRECPRCREEVHWVEQTGLGTVFMCNYGGSRYGRAGCKRTYLSQRDLQAHVDHRHSGDGGGARKRAGGSNA